MGKVTDIRDYKAPHYVIVTEDAAHVIPAETLKRVSSGHMLFSEIENSDDIAATIVREWMESQFTNKQRKEGLGSIQMEYMTESEQSDSQKYRELINAVQHPHDSLSSHEEALRLIRLSKNDEY